MPEAQLTSYEELPYESNPFRSTHPDCLATIATLLGMTPAPVEKCRFLELGCASGGNLIAMALTLPASQFVGIDLSPRQIDMGREQTRALGLPNLELHALNIMDVGEAFGQFDFIVCHGVYSWVPPAVQDKILTICKHNLAPQGVAYVGYKTYPGWHLWSILREMLQFHAQHFRDTATQLHQCRAFLELVTNAVKGSSNVYGRLLEEEADELRKQGDAYLFHEHLEEINDPVYFHQFAERAAAKGLQYVEEAQFSPMPSSINAEVRNILENLPVNLIHQEQYLDFLRGRSFRRTLLCHDNVLLQRPPSLQHLMTMSLTALSRPVAAEPAIASVTAEEFRAPDGRTVATNDPVIKAALFALARLWPRSVTFDDLWQDVQGQLRAGPDEVRERLQQGPMILAAGLMQCYLANLVEVHVHVPPFVLESGEKPLASPLARLQTAAGGPVTNLRHGNVQLNDLDRGLLFLLDGTRNRRMLVEELGKMVAGKELTIALDSQPLQETEKVKEILTAALPGCLQRLATAALLLG